MVCRHSITLGRYDWADIVNVLVFVVVFAVAFISVMVVVVDVMNILDLREYGGCCHFCWGEFLSFWPGVGQDGSFIHLTIVQQLLAGEDKVLLVYIPFYIKYFSAWNKVLTVVQLILGVHTLQKNVGKMHIQLLNDLTNAFL